ncbi:MAG TPA: energy transducer TonB [Pyrinomonadaceae bacterium]|nr:energy transducer TonB [Pyrinomonadaceae bacterium]
MIRFICAICGLLFLVANCSARDSVSVLDFGSSEAGKTAAEKLRAQFRAAGDFLVADADLTRSAALGSGYAGSLNLTVNEARDLGAVLATDFYLLGDAQVLRRSSFEKPVYYEAYCSVFVVSSRTGRLLEWERPSFNSDQASKANDLLLEHLIGLSQKLLVVMRRASEDERIQRTVVPTSPVPLIEEAPADDQAAAAQGLRLPRPYRRLRPEYPKTAALAEAEATVDVAVEIGADGEVGDVQVVRWAGFGLDEATVATVRQMHFFPALKNGTAIPLRVLLRYNFRKPPKE